jgi:hypothetical protein
MQKIAAVIKPRWVIAKLVFVENAAVSLVDYIRDPYTANLEAEILTSLEKFVP